MMRKMLLPLILCISTLGAGAQAVVPIRGDIIKISKTGGNAELHLENATRTRTGAFLKNVGNGVTTFDYALTGGSISGNNLILNRADGNITLNLPVPEVPVSSVFGRTGAITAAVGDYSAFYAPLTGGSGYIQNQITAAQTGNAWVSGTIRAAAFTGPVTSGTDQSAVGVAFTGGQGTGTGNGGNLDFYTTPAGASTGSALNTPVLRMRLSHSGPIGLQAATADALIYDLTLRSRVSTGRAEFLIASRAADKGAAIYMGRNGAVESYVGVAAAANDMFNGAVTGDFGVRTDIGSIILQARNATGNIIFSTQTSNFEKARITNSGNLLIGTTTDNGYKLEVSGTARVIGDLTTSANIQVDPAAASAANRGIFIGGGRAMFGWDGDKLSAFVRAGDVSKHISFGYGSFGTTTEWGRFSATTGNFLIGTTTDAGYKLDVNGSARLNGQTTLGGPLALYASATAPSSPANGWQYYKTATGPQDYVEGAWKTRAYAGGTDYVGSTTDNVLAVTSGVITTKKGFQTATDAATVTLNAALGFNWIVTPTANRTLSITNAQDGEQIALYIVQDATGGRTMVWPAGTVWLNGVEPTLKTAPGDVDRVVFVRNATTATWYASY